MANEKAKKSPDGIVWWTEEDIYLPKLHPLPVEDMWGLKKRALVLRHELKCDTIGDVARLPVGILRARYGVWGDIIHRWANGIDLSEMNPGTYSQPHICMGFAFNRYGH